MKRYLFGILTAAFLLLFLAGCTADYVPDDYIGKTSAEIISEYGVFDYTGMPVSSDGLYRNCQCGYTIIESQKSFLGSSSEVLLLISFDANGVAVACEEGYRPGG
ncbi:MAG: hypothetical protein IJC93_02660 [Clostridia bacterium]|nr:hypothetical protein [Clostridia bacterium]